MASYGLIAGFGWRDLRPLSPGLVCDLYVLRRRYDDDQHGLHRETDNHDISGEDLKLFELDKEMTMDGP